MRTKQNLFITHCSIIYILLQAAKNVLMYNYIHRASELANFVKHITKAFEFSGKKTTKKNSTKCIVYIHHRMISRMRNRWSFAFPLVVPSKVSAWKKNHLNNAFIKSMHVLNFLQKARSWSIFGIHFQFSKKKNEMNFIHQKSFMPKYDISIGSYFFSPARLYTQQQPQPGSHLNSSTGGPCNSGIDFKYRIPAANSIYIHTHMLTTPQYVLTPPTPPPVVASICCCCCLLLIFKW